MDIKILLIRYLKNELTKQQLKEIVIAQNIREDFNNYIFDMLKCTKRKVTHRSRSLSVNALLDTPFLQEIKDSQDITIRQITNQSSNLSTVQSSGHSINWKLSKDELCRRLKMDPKLNAFFILKRNEHVNIRLRRVCIEYGLEANKDVQKVANEGFMHLVRQKNGGRFMFPVVNCVKNISSYTNNKCK